MDIVDASKLEHDLLLALQTLELTSNVVIVLNLMDVAEGKGLKVDVDQLSAMLGVPVIPTVANRGIGMDELLSAVTAVAGGERKPHSLIKGAFCCQNFTCGSKNKEVTKHPEGKRTSL